MFPLIYILISYLPTNKVFHIYIYIYIYIFPHICIYSYITYIQIKYLGFIYVGPHICVYNVIELHPIYLYISKLLFVFCFIMSRSCSYTDGIYICNYIIPALWYSLFNIIIIPVNKFIEGVLHLYY